MDTDRCVPVRRQAFERYSTIAFSCARIDVRWLGLAHRALRDCRREGRHVDSQASNLYFRSMQTLPVKSERLAQLEEFARRRGKSTAEALDDVLADYLEWERQDYQEAVDGVRQGLEDVKADRTKPAEQFFDEFARKHGLPR